MHLYKLAIGVNASGLKHPAYGAAVAGLGIGRAAENQSTAATGNDQGVGREGMDLHAHKVLGHAAAATVLVVDHRAQEIPEFELGHLAGDLPATHLLVQGVKQLLAGGGAGKGRAPIKRTAETSLIAKTLGRAVEGHAQPVHQIDDPRRPIGQFLDRRLVLQEIAAVDGVVEMFPLVIAQLAGKIVDTVNTALAQALWERLTGNRLIRLTLQSSSANFIAAASPANPPPTIITRGDDMILNSGEWIVESSEPLTPNLFPPLPFAVHHGELLIPVENLSSYIRLQFPEVTT